MGIVVEPIVRSVGSASPASKLEEGEAKRHAAMQKHLNQLVQEMAAESDEPKTSEFEDGETFWRARASVTRFEVVGDHGVGSAPFACYHLEVLPESGNKYSITRRWNDLKRCEDEMRRAGCDLKHLIKVEAHSWRSLVSAQLDPAFLSARASQMDEIIAQWLAHFQVKLEPPSGPAALLEFLSSRALGPGLQGTPLRVPTSGGSDSPKSGVLFWDAGPAVSAATSSDRAAAAAAAETRASPASKVLFGGPVSAAGAAAAPSSAATAQQEQNAPAPTQGGVAAASVAASATKTPSTTAKQIAVKGFASFKGIVEKKESIFPLASSLRRSTMLHVAPDSITLHDLSERWHGCMVSIPTRYVSVGQANVQERTITLVLGRDATKANTTKAVQQAKAKRLTLFQIDAAGVEEALTSYAGVVAHDPNNNKDSAPPLSRRASMGNTVSLAVSRARGASVSMREASLSVRSKLRKSSRTQSAPNLKVVAGNNAI